TNRKSSSYVHQLKHTNTKKFKCDFDNCDKTYYTKFLVKLHKNSVHLNVRYVCDWSECRKQFTRNASLLQHKSSVHLNEKIFKCNEENCGKSFVTKLGLKCHKRIHSGEKPFHKINVHMKGKPVYQCSQPNCGQVLNNISHFNGHNISGLNAKMQ
ncbi:unnamed protein product, partial [Oppiella nova]